MADQLKLSLVLSTVGANAAAEAIKRIGASTQQVSQQIAVATRAQESLNRRIERVGVASRAHEILRRQYDQLADSIRRAAKASEQLAAHQERMQRHASAIGALKADAFAVAGMAASFSVPIRSAVGFESAMADVKKVVDGTDEQIAALTEQIKRMGREIPLAHSELAALAAAGGQLGIKIEDLPDFVALTAKMSVAFDMAAETAGDAMAKIANVYQIPIKEIGRLGDAINQISNESPAKASDIVNALSRVGGIAKQFGLSAEQASALSAALIAMGKPPEVAATGINALLTKLMTADKQGKDFQAGLAAIGISAKTLKKAIEQDAQGALLAFLKRLEKLPKEQRMGVLVDLFGMEYADDIAALSGSLDVYRAQLDAVARSEGSMGKEFQARASTTLNAWQLLKNTMSELSIEVGSALLPAINKLIAGLRPVIEGFASWARANQPLIESIGKVLGALLIFKAGALGASFALHGIGFVVASVGASFSKLRLLFSSLSLAWQVFTVSGLPALKSLFVGLYMYSQAALIPALKSIGATIVAVGRAMILSPIGLVLAAIAGAAYLVWRNWDVIGPKLAAVWQTVKEAFAAAWQWISGVPQRMMEAGRAILDGLLAGLRERWQALKETISGIASGIADAVRGALGIRSPSRVFAEIGGHIMGGMKVGIERAADLPLTAIRGATAAVIAAASITAQPAATFAGLAPAVSESAGNIRQHVEQITLPAVADATRTIRQQVEPIALPEVADATRTIRQNVEPVALPDTQPRRYSGAAPSTKAGAPQAQPSINITINLNGQATPEAAQDIAATVRREVERALAETARRDALARRAALIDGGLA